jgi:hypothetical protein
MRSIRTRCDIKSSGARVDEGIAQANAAHEAGLAEEGVEKTEETDDKIAKAIEPVQKSVESLEKTLDTITQLIIKQGSDEGKEKAHEPVVINMVQPGKDGGSDKPTNITATFTKDANGKMTMTPDDEDEPATIKAVFTKGKDGTITMEAERITKKKGKKKTSD